MIAADTLTPEAIAGPRPTAARQMLLFWLNGEAFALCVEYVHEILDPIAMTAVPGAPDFAPGLVNVRGSVLPLLDLRARLGMSVGIRRDAETAERLIVLEVNIGDDPLRLAVMADSVEEVIEVDPATLDPVPELGALWPERFVTGVAHHGDRVVVILNAHTLLQPPDVAGPISQ